MDRKEYYECYTLDICVAFSIHRQEELYKRLVKNLIEKLPLEYLTYPHNFIFNTIDYRSRIDLRKSSIKPNITDIQKYHMELKLRERSQILYEVKLIIN